MTEASHHSAEQELLQQVRWIQGVAFAILRDHELAQDVSQEVLLKALSGERRKGRVLRAWLAAVTRNASISLLRERNRRESREFRAAQPEELAAIRNPLEILEAHESLTKAIHVLPADAREIILLRFFENLDFPAIAQRVGIREDAARVRLHRALGLLRNALGRRESGWQSWCALALPAGTSHLLPASSRIAELLLMKAAKPVAFVLAAGLLLLALIFGPNWRETNSASPDPAAPLAAASTAPAAAESGLATAEPALERSAAPPADSDAAWTIRGQVLVASGGTEGGLRVRAILHDGYDDECPILAETVLTATPDGAITWSMDSPARATYVSMEPETKGVGYGDARLILNGKDPPQDLEIVVFHWTTPFSGVVRNEAGEPIPGALVRGGRDPATTDGEGRYQLMGTTGSQEKYLYAEAEGYAQHRVIVSAPESGPGVADFVLSREFTVSGRVLDENGAPVAGAVVDTFTLYRNSVQTDSAGAFELRHLAQLEPTYRIFARKKGFVEAAADVKTENRKTANQDLVLKRGARVEGRVSGPDGMPVEGASLYIGFSPQAYNRLDTVSHENGEFFFPNVEAGAQTLVAQYPGLAAARQVLQVAEDAPLVAGIELMLAAGRVVAGQVVDATGEPLPGVFLGVRHRRQYVDVKTETDAEGRFRMEGVPVDGAALELHCPGFTRRDIPLEESGQENLLLTLQAAGGLAGRVVDGITGLPIESFRIRFLAPSLLAGERRAFGYSMEWGEGGMLFQSKDGTWSSELELDVGGFLAVEAIAPGYSPARIDKAQVSGKPEGQALEHRLMLGALLRGRVLPRAGGAPVANASLTLLRAEDLSSPRNRNDPRPQAASNEVGEFEFADLPPGQRFLRVEHADWLTAVAGPFDLMAGNENAETTIYLDAGATLRGRALDPAGNPMALMAVELEGDEIPNLPDFKAASRTDDAGRFQISHLPWGRYRITVVRGTGPDRKGVLSMERTLREGDNGETLLQATGSCSIRGRVMAEATLPANLHVELVLIPAESAPESEAVSGLRWVLAPVVAGAYEFPALQPGRYALFIEYSSEDGKTRYSGDATVDLTDGMKVEIDLRPVATKR